MVRYVYVSKGEYIRMLDAGAPARQTRDRSTSEEMSDLETLSGGIKAGFDAGGFMSARDRDRFEERGTKRIVGELDRHYIRRTQSMGRRRELMVV
jgi:hypothetical protein